jgi:hypothetical protein
MARNKPPTLIGAEAAPAARCPPCTMFSAMCAIPEILQSRSDEFRPFAEAPFRRSCVPPDGVSGLAGISTPASAWRLRRSPEPPCAAI